MGMVKLTVERGFRHESRYLQPGDTLELPSDEARRMVTKGNCTETKAAAAEPEKVEPEKAEPEKPAARKSKREYGRRDMHAVTTADMSVTPQPDAELQAKEESEADK